MNKYFVFFILASFSCFRVYGINETKPSMEELDRVLYKRYKGMDMLLHDFAYKSIKTVNRIGLQMQEKVNVSHQCISENLRVMAGVKKLQMWAISFLDASGKLPDGLLSGNSQLLGNYDQCLRSESKGKNEVGEFRGRYCLVYYSPYLPSSDTLPTLEERINKIITLSGNMSEIVRFYLIKAAHMHLITDKFGLCVPSECKRADIEKVIGYVGEQIHMNLSVQYCHTEDELQKLPTRNLIIIAVLVIFIMVCVVGTILQHIPKKYENGDRGIVAKVLLCFSVTKNFTKLMDTKTSDQSLHCLHGVRVLALWYIVLGHNFVSGFLLNAETNYINFATSMPTFFSQIPQNTYLNVDVFFLLGGLVNSYVSLKRTSKREPNFLVKIFLRLWRIYPAYVFTILVTILLTARGPMAESLQSQYTDHCVKYWWHNLLFINNLFGNDSRCLQHTWYVSCDLQLFILSLCIVPVLKKSPKKGVILTTVVMFFGAVFTAIWGYIKRVAPCLSTDKPEPETQWITHAIYIMPYTHITTYFTGVLLGYILISKKEMKITKCYQTIGWLIAILSITSMLFVTMIWFGEGKYTRLEGALYFAVAKVLYTWGVAWIIFCCATGNGGVINYVLSLNLWVPLSKISFMVYLISFPLQLFYVANVRTTQDHQAILWVWKHFGDIVASTLLATAMVVLFESPFIALQKLAFSKLFTKTEGTDVLQNGALKSAIQGNGQKTMEDESKF